MNGRLSQHDVEELLRRLPVSEAPEALWDDVQAELRRAGQTTRVSPLLRPVRSPLLSAAAVLVALTVGTYLGLRRAYDAPSRWEVVPLAGAPTVDGESLGSVSDLEAGDWLITDSVSRAELAVGRIGRAQVGPNSRVRLERARRTQHRLTLERGSLRAAIGAPPRLFLVETPSVLATDLGCAFTLEVDSLGATRIHVTVGWVELSRAGRASLVPAGFVAEVGPGGRPGTPYPESLDADAREALRVLDRGAGSQADLELFLAALPAPTAARALRRQGAISLWHLVQRVDGDGRKAVLERLIALSPPPAGVTREGILALERRMLERWRRELSPMWGEDEGSPVARAASRLWDWWTG